MKTKIINLVRRAKHFAHRHRRAMMMAGLLAVVAFLVIPRLALAAPSEVATPSASSGAIDEMFQKITYFVTFVIKFMERLIWPVLLLIGGLMKNDILFGAGMEERALAIWVQIRNFVNILFVLVLLGIAFYNVVGGSNQSFQLKAILPKFVIGLIAVNFSFFGVKLIIDTVGVMTTAIFALPASVQPGIEKNPLSDTNWMQTICHGLYGQGATYMQNIEANSAWCDQAAQLKGDAKAFFANFDANNAGIVLATNLSKISDWGKISEGVSDFSGLALNTLFAAALFIVFTTAFIALFAILVIRLVVLWVTLVLSPLIVLTYVLPENIAGSVGGGDLKKKFIKNAIAPLPIAIMMTIGFLMLNGLKDSQFTGLASIGLSTQNVSLGLLTSGLSTLQDLIIAVGTIAVIWMGVFEAASGTYADSIVNKIKGTVEGVGKFAASAIQYAPLFPVYTGAEKPGQEPQKYSLAAGLAAIQNIPTSLASEANKQAGQLTDMWLQGNYSKYINKAANAKDPKELVQAGLEMGENVKNFNPYWLEFGRKLQKKEFSEFRNLLRSSYDINDELIKKMQDGTMSPDEKNKAWNMLDAYGRKFNIPRKSEAQDAQPSPNQAKNKPAPVEMVDHTKAKNVLDVALPAHVQQLSKEQQKAVQDYRAAMAKKDQKAADQALQVLLAHEGQDKSALEKLDEFIRESQHFTQEAAQKTTKDELDNLIRQRRAALKSHGLNDPQIAQQLRNELDAIIKMDTPAVKASTETGELKTVLQGAKNIERPEPVATAVWREPTTKSAKK